MFLNKLVVQLALAINGPKKSVAEMNIVVPVDETLPNDKNDPA